MQETENILESVHQNMMIVLKLLVKQLQEITELVERDLENSSVW